MGNPLRNVNTGDPIPQKRATWNAILDAARANLRRKPTEANGAPLDADLIDPANTVIVYNPGSSVTTWPEFSVLAYGDPLDGNNPATGEAERFAASERPAF